MEMVAAAKIRKAQNQIESARPYALKMMEVLSRVANAAPKELHPLLQIHDPMSKVIIVPFTSDRGLCGAFNANVIRETEKRIKLEKQQGRSISIFAIGRKAINYFNYVGYQLFDKKIGMGDKPSFAEAKSVAETFIDGYTNCNIDRIILVFNHFKSAMEQKVVVHQLLPIEPESVEQKSEVEKAEPGYIFEPDELSVLVSLLPTYIETVVYRVILESVASEHAARRTAMKSATDNAGEIISHLVRSFNRARQAQITQEISEIAGGAEALKAARASVA
jgi:F-type H+-transporting ATPase subunit gamma